MGANVNMRRHNMKQRSQNAVTRVDWDTSAVTNV